MSFVNSEERQSMHLEVNVGNKSLYEIENIINSELKNINPDVFNLLKIQAMSEMAEGSKDFIRVRIGNPDYYGGFIKFTIYKGNDILWCHFNGFDDSINAWLMSYLMKIVANYFNTDCVIKQKTYSTTTSSINLKGLYHDYGSFIKKCYPIDKISEILKSAQTHGEDVQKILKIESLLLME